MLQIHPANKRGRVARKLVRVVTHGLPDTKDSCGKSWRGNPSLRLLASGGYANSGATGRVEWIIAHQTAPRQAAPTRSYLPPQSIAKNEIAEKNRRRASTTSGYQGSRSTVSQCGAELVDRRTSHERVLASTWNQYQTFRLL